MGGGTASRAAGVRLKKSAWFAASLCHEPDGRILFSFWAGEASENLGFP